jgi:prepilin-type N-terminal cleavage/methylation domain-containing protein
VTGIHGAESLPRRGMTLVEMLVATTITLIMMGLVAQLFGVFGQGVTGSRSVIELTDQMRSVGWRLRQDLGGATATMLPPRRPEADEGYFELLEGPATDTSTTSLVSQNDTTALTGDCDDALLFTTRSPGAPFVGRFGTGTIESPIAEVAWFCRQATQQLTGGPTLFTLYRRQLLVMDYVGANPFQASGNVLPWSNPMPDSWDTYFLNYEISCSYVPTPSPQMTPNSLRDLTKRENRFSHNPTGVVSKEMYPYPVGSIPPLSGSRLGEDIVLNNVIAFDVRVFDPDAPVRLVASGGSVTPGDPGFLAGSGAEAMGAYVDLFWNRPLGAGPSSPQGTFPPAGMTAFQSAGVFVCNSALPQGNLLLTTGSAVYDTWSTHYESNGIDENGNSFVDEGTNGLDDNANGLVDEPLEAETSAPYPVPLRGIEVRIRCYEPSSRQVRQVTIRHTFVPF